MQSHGPNSPASSTLARILPHLSGILIVYGALGVAINLRLIPLIAEGVSGWHVGRVGWDVLFHAGFLSPLESHYDARPWLAWAAWLVGVALLSTRFLSRQYVPAPVPDIPAAPATTVSSPLKRWLPLAILVVLVLIGAIGRMVELWPQDYGLTRAPYDDEGVYAGTSQLFLQGIIPYRDYFFAHPPIAALAYAPAMAYHFTEWGSPTSFMMARYLSVFYSLITLALLFGIGYRLAGLWGGTLAGGLWAIDGRVVEINRKIMLEGPLVLLSCAAVLLYLWIRPSLSSQSTPDPGAQPPNRKWYSALRGPRFTFFLVGVLATLSALTKIAGLACLLAIAADMIWLWLENRRTNSSKPSTAPTRTAFLSLIVGAIVTFLVVVGPFLVLAPSQFLREVLFFQFLRPSDGVVDSPARVADLTATLANALTPMLAALGFIILSLWVYTRTTRSLGPWRIGILWTFFSLILFTYSRSFYQHYYIQLAAPLCLLAAGVSLLPGILRRYMQSRSTSGTSRANLAANISPLVLLLLIGFPLIVIQWTGMTTRNCPHCQDPIFQIVSRYVNDAVPPGSTVLSSDEQFNILAARPPSLSPTTGYLIDSYGHMISLGLNLDTRDWGDLISSALNGDHGNDPYRVMQSERPQADFLERAALAPLIVIHERGFVRLSPDTQAIIDATYKVAEQQSRYTIYRGNTVPAPR